MVLLAGHSMESRNIAENEEIYRSSRSGKLLFNHSMNMGVFLSIL